MPYRKLDLSDPTADLAMTLKMRVISLEEEVARLLKRIEELECSGPSS